MHTQKREILCDIADIPMVGSRYGWEAGEWGYNICLVNIQIYRILKVIQFITKMLHANLRYIDHQFIR